MTETTTNIAFGCRGLTKTFGTHRVLDGLDLTVTPGRVYALLGRNGAGKSTSLKIMLGLATPDCGQTYLLGRPFTRSALAHVGASIDGPALYRHLSAKDNLRVHAHLTGINDTRIDEVLAHVGLAATGGAKTRTFSTGMKARLALAIALLTDPQVLILDEPQNGLDPEGIIELRDMIRGLAAQGRTILISSHQLGEVVRLADDIGVLAHGRLLYEGPLNDFAQGDLEAAYLAATTGSHR
ncbi:ATP-binding cassette domain-containing protein [Dermatophilus congolensis]|uniref:ATP-binding cassette domain-containing protein n=1 Tax=Dermatophilus congolensis TaxID=1863 RepID=UPI001AAF6FD9|nr:ATP-binding cassette domain-containing protein [Dermatophilus congolensis]MBO3142022.1 ATP-binding cassette domain-containing protein [Dermatophilus congolensis]MBO3151013.1 ATP-binding cassette domain-containing protein [Dermatophilus congolensis]MBO3161982.1 ATP-binding cassette domain-containing protein [Dermatophilus congolensis]MBO3162297.1 ATP-binding cassette domain-containing protein [Dermatophilus congolensis]MBO3175851.1 ATP-binding cassette domain-containing protein [Dermatophilu